ncbi:DUF2652 domain-containing protein [Parapedobacter koreensis]|uniref:DUF2652 domain-containing protein n=1 Tax=Parapedobacter koreensis TaxID=332977 RepID=A0A1H7P7E3_9SPHI|nr:DUF2652 domain-containing protein [Parapedobacter koreensis]SEL31673.1 Protein of unknown function [Parapedobacter koreensis]
MEENKKGIVFIPDISGYSLFVKQTDNQAGAEIIAHLLDAVIQSNYLSFKISEIEGDAILFYRYGSTFPIKTILKQYEAMLNAFKTEVNRLAIHYPLVRKLSLKVVVHYGAIEAFSLKGFYKLYGNTVMEAHRLLKNNLGMDTYALITDTYLDNEKLSGNTDSYINDLGQNGKICELFNDIGKICYSFFPFASDSNYASADEFALAET